MSGPARPEDRPGGGGGGPRRDGMEIHQRPWHVLGFTFIGSFMAPFDGTVVAVALPKIGATLHMSFVDAIWVQATYLLVMTVALIPLGRLGDAWGRLRFYRAGIIVFTLSSLLAGLSQSVAWLLTARCLEGLGAALMAASSTALVTDAFPAHQRGRALGLNTTAVYLGLAVGPVLGGLLTQHLGWRSIFLVNIPVGVACLAWGWPLVELRERAARLVLDVRGALLFAAAVSLTLVGLTLGPVVGWTSPLTVAIIAAGVVLLAVYLLVEAHTANPILDLKMFTGNRVFAAANLAALANYMAFTAVTVLVSVLLEVVAHRSAQDAGLLLTAEPVFMCGLAATAGRLSDRWGSRWLSTGGMVVIASGLLALATIPAGIDLVRLEATLAAIGTGMAAFSAPNTSAVMGSVDRSRLGVAAATLGTMRFLGQSVSVAVLGAIAASPLGTQGQMALFSGRISPGSATAYLQGFHSAMAVGAAIALVGAVASLARGPATEPQRAPQA